MTPNPSPAAPGAQHPSASPTSAYLADEVGTGGLSLGLLLIDATRYNLSRPGGPATAYALALAQTWPQILPHVRRQLQQDIEQALLKDARAHSAARGMKPKDEPARPTSGTLGTVADRQGWEQVRQAWLAEAAGS